MVTGDLQASPIDNPDHTFVKTDVTSFSDLTNLFKTAIEKYKRIDHVFANAGIATRADYIDGKVDDNGDLIEPTTLVYDINLRGCINTCALAIHYMKKQQHSSNDTSSITVTASASSFQPFRLVDYATAKHGVLGFMRGLTPLLHPILPIRINAISPSWTITGLCPKGLVEDNLPGVETQEADVVGRSVAILMADPSRHGQLIYSVGGRYSEIEHAVLAKAAEQIVGPESEDVAMRKLIEAGAFSKLGLPTKGDRTYAKTELE